MYYHDFLSVGIDVGSEISWACIITPDHKPVSKPIKIDHQNIESLDALKRALEKSKVIRQMQDALP